LFSCIVLILRVDDDEPEEEEEEPKTGALALSLSVTNLSLNLLNPRPSFTLSRTPPPVPPPPPALTDAVRRGALSRSSVTLISFSFADAVACSALSAETTRCLNAGRGMDEVLADSALLFVDAESECGVAVGGRSDPYLLAIALELEEARIEEAVEDVRDICGGLPSVESTDEDSVLLWASRRTVD
jgi:hypothetical protein